MYDLFGNASVYKTKPVGLPYKGSKRKYADELICKMMELKPHSRYFYDLCGGGGAMSFAALQKGMAVIYNDAQTDLVNFIKFIFDCSISPKSKYGIFPEQYYSFISREKFETLKHETGNYAEFARICYSFGNNQRTYLFSKEIEVNKQLAHDLVVYRDKKACKQLNENLGSEITISQEPTLTKRRLVFRKSIMNNIRLALQQLEHLKQLEHLERLQQLEGLQQRITFQNCDYRAVDISTPSVSTIVYIDPPYRNTDKYVQALDHDELDAWFAELPYTAFMSEYSAPFKCIYEIQTRSVFNSSKTCSRVEKLYINQRC